jgi:pyridoxal phosphate enzyme (YggS family)
MSIHENIRLFSEQIPANIKLVAVSKTKPSEIILEAYEAGQRVFGENRIQELIAKQPELPGDIEWHFVGHLQTNKVKFIAPFVSLIHAVDSLKLLKEINKQAVKNDRTIKCLLQFHIATESTKYGLNLEEAIQILQSEEITALKNVSIVGVMGMGTFTDNTEQVRQEFKSLKSYFDQLKRKFFNDKAEFCEISMGMTGDYLTAIEEGSTIIRIGTAIFGERFR